MAGVGWKATTVPLATGTAVKTILQVVAPTNQALLIHEWSVSFEGVSNTALPINVELTRQSTAGTTSANTPVLAPDGGGETLQVTARDNATVEPTSGDVIDRQLVHPQTGYTWQATFDKKVKVRGGDRLAIRTTAAVDVNVVATFKGEE